MAKRLKVSAGSAFFIAAFAVFVIGCTSLPSGYQVPLLDESGELRDALDKRLDLAENKALFIGPDSFRFDLTSQEHRVAQAIVQIVPYDVDQRRSHGKGVGLVLSGLEGQQFLLTAAHILYHPQTRMRRANDLMVFRADPDAPPHILSSKNLPPRFNSLMPFLTHMDDILLIPIEPMAGITALPLERLMPLDLDANPMVEADSQLTSVSCDYLSEEFPTACFAQGFTRLESRRINLYSAVTSDLDVYPGLSGSPVLAITDAGITVLGVIISGSRETDCPAYALPDCYALIGPVTDEALDKAGDLERLRVREEFREHLPTDRKDLRDGWWRDY